MKKSVLALAVLGAFAGVASAQSSVTLFGVVDLNVRTIDNNDRTYQLGQDGMSSSRLGFRGVEDLGGGLKAGFWLEAALGPDTGTGSGSFGNSSRDTNALIFNRRSTLSLSNQWGEMRLGRDYTATFWNWTVFDPFGTNGVGAATNLALGNDLAGALQPGSSYGTLVRANNMVAYILPAGQFGPGLYGQAQVAAGENAPGNKYYGGRIGWAGGVFNVAASFGETDVDTSGNTTLQAWNVGGSWDFKILKLSGFFGSMELDGPFAQAKRENWYVGVAAPFGQWNFKASYGGTNGSDFLNGVDASQWAIGADYNLSKRTALYITASSISNDCGTNLCATFSTAPGTSSPLSGGNSSTGGEIGIRHTF